MSPPPSSSPSTPPPLKQTRLIGTKTILIPYMLAHVPTYHRWMQSPFLLSSTASEPLTLSQEYAVHHSWTHDPLKHTFIILDTSLLTHPEDEDNISGPHLEAMVGDVNLYLNDVEDREVGEVEVMVAEERSRGKGIGREAVEMMMGFARRELGVRRFRVKIGIGNVASVGLFTKLGFVEVSRSEVFQEVTMELSVGGGDDGMPSLGT